MNHSQCQNRSQHLEARSSLSDIGLLFWKFHDYFGLLHLGLLPISISISISDSFLSSSPLFFLLFIHFITIDIGTIP